MTASLIASIAIFYCIIIAVNIPASFLNIRFGESASEVWYAPPGYVITIVWFVLFTLYGIARHKLIGTSHESLVYWIYALAFLCAAYAYYTIGLAQWTGVSALWFGLIGNIVVILCASFVTYTLWLHAGPIALFVAPTIIWTSYATLIVLGEMRLEELI